SEGRERAESMCSNFWPCTDHPMDHGLNGHCLKGLCPGDRRPPHKVHLAPMGHYNYPRRHSKLERETNPPGRLPSYKSYDTGAGFSKKPRS
uniref:ORF270/2 n=1 Tax=Beta vulgaris subsp. vulgaris TaxID=3555 RepID=Q05897_BETVV|nr:unnamed protein product [Beta vulgaris subsp. vulgaris]